MAKKTLPSNQSYLIITTYGNAFRTRTQKDYESVLAWGDIVFHGLVKNNHFVFMKLGAVTEIKFLISKIPLARPMEQSDGIYEISEVTQNIPSGTSIKECWVAGRK